MSPLEIVLRHVSSGIGAQPDEWRNLLTIAHMGLDKLLAIMPADLAEAVRAFLDKEITP